MSTTEDCASGELRAGYAEISDQRLHYVEAGEGPLLVLLHGFPEFCYGWRLQIKPLAAAGFGRRSGRVRGPARAAHRVVPRRRGAICQARAQRADPASPGRRLRRRTPPLSSTRSQATGPDAAQARRPATREPASRGDHEPRGGCPARRCPLKAVTVQGRSPSEPL